MADHYGIKEEQLYLYNRGEDYRCYQYMGAHPHTEGGVSGVRFALWAPGVKSVSVTGDFCGWDNAAHPLSPAGTTGVWVGFVPEMQEGELYKYFITPRRGKGFLKADPVGFSAELRPGTASRVAFLEGYKWHDGAWMYRRRMSDHFAKPMNIYEVHLGSWRQHDVPRASEQDVPPGAFYTYRELAEELVPYVRGMGYTHIEILPLMEHPFDGSWGYQVTGFYAPTSRYGSPKDLMYLIDCCHKQGIGVILDWVPGHFCRDEHGLVHFTGQKLYEDKEHVQWGTFTFNFARSEVRSFLLSNAIYWLELYHADGIRVDGVSSMLYLNYGLDNGEPKRFNKDGGEGNLEAIDFLREFNRIVGEQYPGVFTVAEESSAWPMVTRPAYQGGLGFHYKWDMGWMNDTLNYMKTDFPFRPGNHRLLTFSMMYAFSENFILPLSHDEVVHGKASLIGRMPGDYWRQFAGLRLLLLYQITHPGGKLSFMGNEIAQFIEWRYYEGLEWFLLNYPQHNGHHEYVRALNHLYLEEPALWRQGFSWEGFKWVDADNAGQSIAIYIREGIKTSNFILCALNFCPASYPDYRIGVPRKGYYREIFNSNESRFGGNDSCLNPGYVKAEKIPSHGFDYSVSVHIPPIGGVLLRRYASKPADYDDTVNASAASAGAQILPNF